MSQRKEARPQMILRRRTKHDLPEEIVLEILARLPVKSLLRFRCVCKTWYSYITSPNFISTHLLCYNNHDGGFVIHMPRTTVHMAYIHRPHSQICTLALDRTFETISEFRIPFTFQSGYPDLVGSCNGILCVTDFVTSKSNDVYLWNPSIRKFKRLPNTCLTRLSYNVVLGFGYDSLNNDYKVVRLSWTCTKWVPPPKVEVYSLSSDSWKRVELGISWRPNVMPYGFKFEHAFTELCSIWVMREYGVLDSWNKLCVLPIGNPTAFIGFTKYGLLLVRNRSRLVSTNSELERKDESVLIDPEALHEKEISNQIDYLLDVATYMENLALLDGENVVSY